MAGSLTAFRVKANLKPGRYSDNQNDLMLFVRKSGGKSWVQRIVVNGVRRDIGLGAYPAVSLHDARNLAAENKDRVKAGQEPVSAGQSRKANESPTIPTYRELSATVFNLNAPRWKSERTKTNWRLWNENIIFPAIGDKPVDQITRADVLGILEPLWVDKYPTAQKVRVQLRTVQGYAVGKEIVPVNHAGEAINKVLIPAPNRTEHHPAIPYAQVGAVMRMVDDDPGMATTKAAFKFLVLTAARSGEVRYAEWSEIDWASRTWTIPEHRMKKDNEHRVPLSDYAMEVLEEVRRLPLGHLTDCPYIFPKMSNGNPLNSATLLAMLKRMEVPAVPHGFRSTFRDFGSEQTSAPWAVLESSIAHVRGDSGTQAYDRSDLLERRRVLMQEWADYIRDTAPVN